MATEEKIRVLLAKPGLDGHDRGVKVLALALRVVELLKEQGAEDIMVIGGGIIPESDIPELKAKGTREVFGPGTSTADIVRYIQAHAPKRA
jgi:methylmalonyl-CoA mutase C-terminal domain/subunit